MKVLAFFITFSLLSAFSIAQNKSVLIGKWKLVKHEVNMDGKISNLITKDRVYTLEFLANGNYTAIYNEKNKKIKNVYKGKWSLNEKGDTLKLYNITSVKSGVALTGERFIALNWINSEEIKEFTIKELLFNTDKIIADIVGTSTYQKQECDREFMLQISR